MAESGTPGEPAAEVGFRISLRELLYAVALAGAATATFGWLGLAGFLILAAVWTAVHWHHRPLWQLLGEAGLAVLVMGAVSVMTAPTRFSGKVVQCANNMKQLALAIHTYHSTYSQLPPAHYVDANHKPIHSWRVAIWNFVASQPYFEKYKWTEPWDGPSNKRLHVDTYLVCPSRHANSAPQTSYFAIVGDNAAFPPGRGRKLTEFDDPAHTIVFLEHRPSTQHWMAPGDLSFDEAVALLTRDEYALDDQGGCLMEDFYFVHAGATRTAAMADGSVRRFPCGLAAEDAKRWLQVRKDRPFGMEESYPELAVRSSRPNWGNWIRLGIFLALALIPMVFASMRRAQ